MLTKIMTLLILLTCSINLTAQWEEAIVHHITENAMTKDVSNRSLTVDEEDNLHILWQQNNNSIQELWYTIRHNDGTWGNPIQINDPAESVYNPSIVVAGPDKIYITFSKQSNDANSLFLSVLTSEGQTTSRISAEGQSVFTPALNVDNEGFAHFAWVALNDTTGYKVYYSNNKHLELAEEQQLEELQFSNLIDSATVHPSIAVSDEGIVYISYTGDAGPSGQRIFVVFQNLIGTEWLWSYSFLGESANDYDESAIMAIEDDKIHLIYGGFHNSGVNRIFHTKRDLGNANWNAHILLAENTDIVPEAIFIDNSNNLHLTCNRADTELFYSSNQSGLWATETLLGNYPIFRSSIAINSNGQGYVLAEQGIPDQSEQVILWGAAIEQDTTIIEDTLNTSLTDLTHLKSLQISPNPATDYININGIEAGENITIYSLTGQILYTNQITNQESLRISIKDWKTGLYFVKSAGKNQQKIQKLLIK